MRRHDSNSTAGIRVLLAEDDREFRALLAGELRKEGYSVTECEHGMHLLSRLKCLDTPSEPEDFDLIISDVRMPGVTGLSILEGLHEYENVPPVILITAFGDGETHAAAKRLGAAAMLDKPFEMSDLLAAARAALSDDEPLDRPSFASMISKIVPGSD
jgi:DNA-binding response OmpR family regulator